MADEHLTEGSDWVEEIFQVSLDTKWKGGADGTANMQAQALAARTRFLKDLATAVKLKLNYLIQSAGLIPSDDDQTLVSQAITKMIQAGQRSVVINNAVFAPAVTAGAAVYFDSANSRFDLAIADGSFKQNAVGFADTAGANLYCFGDGILFSGLTPGARYYLSSTTAGAITTAAPLNVVSIGTAKSATELFIDIDGLGFTPTQAQQNAYAVAAASGTADAITASFTPPITTLTDGTMVEVRCPSTNATSTPTLQANATVAKGIVKGHNLALAPGDIPLRAIFKYDITLDKWVLINPELSVKALGVGQTSQSKTKSKALSTNYTNTSGSPIFVNVIASVLSPGACVVITVDGISYFGTSCYDVNSVHGSSCFAIVPNGSVYSAECSTGGNGSLISWAELRP